MSVCRKLPDGTIQKIAGHTILLDANANEVREGTANIPTPTEAEPNHSQIDVMFTDPMPDTDYAIILEVLPEPSYHYWNTCIDAKTVNGFTISCWPTWGSAAPSLPALPNGYSFRYTAFKPVKIEGYTALQNKVNNPDDTPTIDSMNLVTSDGVARAIENASAVWKGTKAEWNALPATTKIKYDLAVLIDTQLIKSVDRTDGSDSNVADLTGKIFRGTEEEWNALTDAEKDEYEQAELVAAPSDVDLNFNYSTDETLTGATWYDGKPVYRRVFTNLPISSTWAQHVVDIGNQDSLVSYTILGKSGVSGDTHMTPYFDGTGDNFQVAVVVGSGSINYWGSASTITSFDMVVEYTKTTD